MSSVIAPYFTNEMRTQVLKMLGLKQDSFKKGLVRVLTADKEESGKRRILIHYDIDTLEKLQSKAHFTRSEREEITNLASTRGIIVDLNKMEIIKKSYPQTVNIPTAFVSTNIPNPIMTSDGEVIPEWGIYKTCYGGTLLHSYHYEGKIYLSTFKHFDVTNSHFCDSDNFVDSWLKNQDIYKSVDDLYPEGSDLDIVHVFILNDRKLLVDTRENQDEDRVIYLESFSMKDNTKIVDLTEEIKEANSKVSKPITFCKELSPNEVNARLRGTTIDVSDDYEGDRFDLYSKFQCFFGGEKVIYRHSLGICTLVPPSCKFRQRIMEGKNNINKLFVDCMADKFNEKELVDVAFSHIDCLRIAKKLQNGETIYVDQYQTVNGDKQLKVLTNLIFTVPLNRIPEVITAYDDFEERLVMAVYYLVDNYEDLKVSFDQDKLATYPGISSKKFRDYLCKNFKNIGFHECTFNEFWPEVLKSLYGRYYNEFCDSEENSDEEFRNCVNMALVTMVGDAYDDVLYTFITFEDKVTKARAAAEKRNTR